MEAKPMHESLAPLKFMLGKWRSTSAVGKYVDRVPSFAYCEELEFTTCGQPMFNYSATTWHAADKAPMHLETGYMRIRPGTMEVHLLLAHNFGITTIEEGVVDDANSEVKLKSTSVCRSALAKEPQVTAIERTISLLEDGKLQVVLCMATSMQPEMAQHLAAVYEKVEQ